MEYKYYHKTTRGCLHAKTGIITGKPVEALTAVRTCYSASGSTYCGSYLLQCQWTHLLRFVLATVPVEALTAVRACYSASGSTYCGSYLLQSSQHLSEDH
jgi:hypothetical protein